VLRAIWDRFVAFEDDDDDDDNDDGGPGPNAGATIAPVFRPVLWPLSAIVS
jgi:hypothetical protein